MSTWNLMVRRGNCFNSGDLFSLPSSQSRPQSAPVKIDPVKMIANVSWPVIMSPGLLLIKMINRYETKCDICA